MNSSSRQWLVLPGIVIVAVLGWLSWSSLDPLASTDQSPEKAHSTDATGALSRAPIDAIRTPEEGSSTAVGEPPGIDYEIFRARAARLLGPDNEVTRDFYLSLRDPEAFIDSLETLAESGTQQQAMRSEAAAGAHTEVQSFELSLWGDGADSLDWSLSALPGLPGYPEFNLQRPASAWPGPLLLRWVDVDAGEVVSLQLVLDVIPGEQQRLAGGPQQRTGDAVFRVEVYDATDEDFQRLAARSLAVGPRQAVDATSPSRGDHN